MNKETNTKPVWDIGIRLFHWTLVVSFITAYVSGEEENLVHTYAGYLILGLLCFRIVWGLVGSQHARFKDFIYSPSAIWRYTKSMFNGEVEEVKGHNPVGGLMVFALLICLTLTTLSGLKVYGLEGHGPLANNTSWFIAEAQASAPQGHDKHHEENEAAEHFWEEIHEFFANFTVLLILLHITGVVVSSRLEKQNLAKAMITGYKQS